MMKKDIQIIAGILMTIPFIIRVPNMGLRWNLITIGLAVAGSILAIGGFSKYEC